MLIRVPSNLKVPKSHTCQHTAAQSHDGRGEHGRGDPCKGCVCIYLTQKTSPDECSVNQKQVIRKKALKFQVSETGELLYRHKLKGKVINSAFVW